MNNNFANNNHNELHSFVHFNSLQDNKGRIIFNASVHFDCNSKNEDFFNVEIRVEFNGYDNYGRLIIHEGFENEELPISFDAKFQKFINKKTSLEISGNYKNNPDIGNYVLKIIPDNI